MMTRPALLLDQHDARASGELGCDACAGNARADDKHVGRNRFGQAAASGYRWVESRGVTSHTTRTSWKGQMGGDPLRHRRLIP
jgi:hypothetical protein